MLTAIVIAVLIAGVALSYVLIVRPILRRWKFLAEFWKSADDFEISAWGKIKEVFDGLKIKLLARLMWVPALFVQAYDYVGPYLAGADFSPLTANLPAWVSMAAPIAATIAIPMLIDWARSYSSEPAATGPDA